MMVLALCDASKKCRGRWCVHGISPESYASEFPKVCKVWEEQKFFYHGLPQIVVLTAGVGEDSMTLYVNGLINSGKTMALTPDGFLNLRDETLEVRAA